MQRSELDRISNADIHTLNLELARCNTGDRGGCDAFYLQLFLTFWKNLQALLVKYLKARYHDAEDTVANLLLSYYVRALDGRFTQAPLDWEKYLATSVVRQYLADIATAQRSTPSASPEELKSVLFKAAGPITEMCAADEVEQMFVRAWPTFTPTQRNIVALRSQSWSYREIASRLGTTENSTRVLACRARKTLCHIQTQLRVA